MDIGEYRSKSTPEMPQQFDKNDGTFFFAAGDTDLILENKK